ncbi:MAG: SAM-dependent methyltransferase, partial [Brevundimonas diminuta]|nr:SAM-dependent methyltransferase [Brevundimonas diminuta]
MSAPSPSSGPPIIFDAARRAARLSRAARHFPDADFLHLRAADNAVNSLEVI